MSFLDTKNKKKSFVVTIVLMIGVLLLMLINLMTKFDPPIENGIAVNLGYMDDGSGDVQPLQPINSAPQEVTPTQPEDVSPNDAEHLLTNETEDAPVIPSKETDKPIKKNEDPTKKKDDKPVDPQPSKTTTNVLDNIINGPTNPGTTTQGEGDGNNPGDKGQKDGDPYAASYYGGPGKGSGGSGYGLKGRGRPTYSKVQQNCNETGIVVVKIVVNRSGNVISAEPGVKGTTNNAPCLTKPAKEIALTYKWPADSKAPEQQIGFVVVSFDVGE